MYNVLIVDDEEKIREGLKRHIKWNDIGFDICGVCQSAEEAISFIDQEDVNVDVLLTDIVMGGDTGLQLIKEALVINPQLKTVIISGYDEFSFAKEAIRLGTFDYLSKPFNLREVISIFNRLKQLLDQDQLENLQKKELVLLSKERFFNHLVNGYYNDPKEIIKMANNIGIELADRSFCVIRINFKNIEEVDNIQYDDYIIKKRQIMDMSQKHFEQLGKTYIFGGNIYEIFVIVYAEDTTRFNDCIEAFDALMNEKNGQKHIYIGVGRFYREISGIRSSYYEAGKAIEYRIIKNQRTLLFHKEISEFFKGRSMITSQIESKIVNMLVNQEVETLKAYILNLLSEFKFNNLGNENVLYDISIEMFIIINNYMSNMVGAIDSTTLKINDYNTVRHLLTVNDFEEVSIFLSDYLSECKMIIEDNSENSTGLIINNIRKYIDDHYYEDINLDMLSKIVYINPYYLSKLFKEKTGENYISYLTRVRIENAKKLLRNPEYKIYSISEMVGYDSARHLSKVFKEFTGLTPKEYRNTLSNSENVIQ